ncbi:hypothetical protein DFJ58DRAFT_728639 [Suillus subalutaceus]|uniref:uncharacterized protein n=1 Tax=Suillus subalutaceus TaxID=48586 RepID=UPI001B879910|nr:uncharacterized protein DFJ58DRAFT_728639 [Suillus subalutaceus]KAG1852091.1 hypothetical protein DFJ58DRAFT_728639 [Suillus subalutaceus]
MNPIPADWALSTIHIASEYVSRQFSVLIGVGPKVLPPIELDVVLLMACSKLARTLAKAYRNPVTINFDITRYSEALQTMETGLKSGREELLLAQFPLDRQIILEWPAVVLNKFGIIFLWYLPGAIDAAIQNDMMAATVMMSGPLGTSITCGAVKDNKWHTHESNFQSSDHGLTPGCINLSPAWFLQGHPAMQRLAALIAAALRVMHPSLYWSSLTTQLGLGLWAANNQLQDMGDLLRVWGSVFTVLAVMCNRRSPLHRDALSRAQWFDVMLSVGSYGPARMWMPNIGIEIAYNSGVMAAASGRIVWHGVDNVNGDRIS